MRAPRADGHYARFADISQVKQELLREPPSAPVCIAAREVVVDYLDPPDFVGLCRRLRGDRIDAVSALADLPWDGTVGGIDRQVDAEERRDTAAQARALRRLVGIGARERVQVSQSVHLADEPSRDR